MSRNREIQFAFSDRHGKIQYCYSKVHICNFGEEDDESVLDAGDDFFVTEWIRKKEL